MVVIDHAANDLLKPGGLNFTHYQREMIKSYRRAHLKLQAQERQDLEDRIVCNSLFSSPITLLFLL